MNNRLKQHYEKLIYLNSVHHYTQSGNAKIDKYYKLLKEIRKEFIVNSYNPASFFNPTLNPIQQLKNK